MHRSICLKGAEEPVDMPGMLEDELEDDEVIVRVDEIGRDRRAIDIAEPRLDHFARAADDETVEFDTMHKGAVRGEPREDSPDGRLANARRSVEKNDPWRL